MYNCILMFFFIFAILDFYAVKKNTLVFTDDFQYN